MNLTTLTVLVIFASALLFSGCLLQWYVGGKIDGLEYMLKLNGLTEYDKGMLTGTVDWWIIQRFQLFNPISYFLITAGIVTCFFSGLSIWKETLHNRAIKQKTYDYKENVDSQNNTISDKSLEIELLKSKILQFEKKLALSKSQINNLKENINLMTKIINDSQPKTYCYSNTLIRKVQKN